MDVINPSRAHFFSLPFELRQRIFYLAIRAHAGVYGISTREINEFGKKREEIRPNPAPHEQPMGRRFAWVYFWGSDEYTKIFPISRQWYSEIQEALYSSFTFELCTIELIRSRPTSFCLDFLPLQAMPLIRHVELLLYLDRSCHLHADEDAVIVRGFQDISAQLTGLRTVSIFVCAPSIQYVSPHIRPRFLKLLLDISRPFKKIPQFELVPRHHRYSRVETREGIPYELLVRECIEVLEKECNS